MKAFAVGISALLFVAGAHADFWSDARDGIEDTARATVDSVDQTVRNPGQVFQNTWDAARSNPVGTVLNPMRRINPSGLPGAGDLVEIGVTRPQDLARYVQDPRQLFGAPLAAMIWAARERAVSGGVQGIPSHIRAQLAPYFAPGVLNSARFTTQWGLINGELQTIAMSCGGARAVTLVDVIVFRNHQEVNDPTLWAHELHHVEQYASWGLPEFARMYTLHHGNVEDPAYQRERGVANKLAAYRQPPQFRNPPQFQQAALNASRMSMMCTVIGGGACQMNMAGPVGGPCTCFDGWGRPYRGMVQ